MSAEYDRSIGRRHLFGNPAPPYIAALIIAQAMREHAMRSGRFGFPA